MQVIFVLLACWHVGVAGLPSGGSSEMPSRADTQFCKKAADVRLQAHCRGCRAKFRNVAVPSTPLQRTEISRCKPFSDRALALQLSRRGSIFQGFAYIFADALSPFAGFPVGSARSCRACPKE